MVSVVVVVAGFVYGKLTALYHTVLYVVGVYILRYGHYVSSCCVVI